MNLPNARKLLKLLYKLKKPRNQLVIIVFTITLLGLSLEFSPSFQNFVTTNQPGLYSVDEVSDGDTIVVSGNGISNERVRLIGVDTPELHHPNKPVQCFARSAQLFLDDKIAHQEVRLEADALGDNRDRYNRLLRYVYLPDGELLNAQIISEGYGFAYTAFEFEKSEEFMTLEKNARKNNHGLWSRCDITTNNYGGQETVNE